MVQDYVPARSNLSTGLIVKSHILERNKYERYEPEVEITNNYSESIDLITISGTDPDEIPWSTANTTFSQFAIYPLANNTGSDINYIPVEINNNYSWEKYTGEFGGSTLDVVTGDFSQIEASSMTNPGPHSGPIVFSKNCKSISICNNSGSAFSASFVDCNNVSRAIVVSSMTCTINYCMDPNTLIVGTIFSPVPTSAYNLIDGGSCQDPLMCNRYSFTLSGSFAGNSYSGSYRDCTGSIQQISFSTSVDTQMDFCSVNTEVSIIKTPAVGFPSLTEYYPVGFCTYSVELPTVFYNEGATYNNVTKAVTSTRFTEAEYSYGIGTPVNMSSIISQSSCQSCNRLNCYNLTIANPSTSSQTFTYQDCNNESKFISLSGSEASEFCAKSNTLNFLYAASASLEVQQGDVCGAAFSNYPYIGNCKYVSVRNNTTSSFDISYKDCNNDFRIVIVSGSTTSMPECLDPNTLTVGTFGVLPTSSYAIFDYGFCNYPFPYYLSTQFTKYCDFLGAYDLYSTGSGVPYSIQYQTCGDGTVVSASGVTPGGGIVVRDIKNQCIRSGSLVTSGDVFPDIVTGSLSYCGFYEDPTPYTGSRTPVEIQEYNYNRTSTLNSKYAGAKNSSAKYNVYTKGDQSYPGYAAADNYVGYTGLFTNVESSSYYPDQMVVKLTYFSDTSGGLNDLNLQNNNWVYMQNIYKPDSIITIKQFNATQFSNQYYLDKQFKVVESGYSYQPYWYRLKTDSNECYRSEFSENSSGSNYLSTRFFPNYENVTRILNNGYPPSIGDDWPYIPTGSSESDFSGSANDYQLSLYNTNEEIKGSSNLVTYYHEVPGSPSGTKFITGSYYKIPQDGIYSMYSKLFPYIAIVSASFPGPIYSNIPISRVPGFDINIYLVKNPRTSSGYIDGGTIIASGSILSQPPDNVPTKGYIYNASAINESVFLQKDDRIFTKVVISNWTRAYDHTPSFPIVTGIYPDSYYNKYELVSAQSSYCIPISGSNNQVFSSSYMSSSNMLPLTKDMSVYFDVSGSSTFLPEISSSLYPLLGDVNYTTQIDTGSGDFIIFYYNGSDVGLPGNSQIYPISRRIIGTIQHNEFERSIEIYPSMPAYITAANINNYQKLAFIKKEPDESVVILQGKKRTGKTSYGFLVPQDINPYILQNINTLQSSIQSQILDY
jgi:hypothetical protein